MLSATSASSHQNHDYVHIGQQALRTEAHTLLKAAQQLTIAFEHAVRILHTTRGRVVFTGLGKSGHICAKLASTFSSTGTPALFLHPSEALHGDFGMIQSEDVLCAIAYSGTTPEVCTVAQFAKQKGLKILTITGGGSNCLLARIADVFLDGSVEKEADPLGLAPTSSSTLALALGDALAISLIHAKNFTRESFGRLHPGGALGKSLRTAKEFMILHQELRSVTESCPFQAVLTQMSAKNYGIVPVLNHKSQLVGCITDGDLRRTLLKLEAKALQKCAEELMHPAPKAVPSETPIKKCIQIMQEFKITRLFVISADKTIQGMLQLQDII